MQLELEFKRAAILISVAFVNYLKDNISVEQIDWILGPDDLLLCYEKKIKEANGQDSREGKIPGTRCCYGCNLCKYCVAQISLLCSGKKPLSDIAKIGEGNPVS
jgi:hypothetical protein